MNGFDRLQVNDTLFVDFDRFLETLTYNQAKKNALKSPSLSKVLAIVDCTTENYDDKINCSGKGFVCYEEDTAAKAWEPFDKYVKLTTATNPVNATSSDLWMTQAHWQSSAESIVIGTLHRSSILEDEARSGVNKRIE
eukprot:gene31264-38629_t